MTKQNKTTQPAKLYIYWYWIKRRKNKRRQSKKNIAKREKTPPSMGRNWEGKARKRKWTMRIRWEIERTYLQQRDRSISMQKKAHTITHMLTYSQNHLSTRCIARDRATHTLTQKREAKAALWQDGSSKCQKIFPLLVERTPEGPPAPLSSE